MGRRLLWPVSILFALTACGGGHQAAVLPASPAANATTVNAPQAAGVTRVTLKLDGSPESSSTTRRTLYVSAATQSVVWYFTGPTDLGSSAVVGTGFQNITLGSVACQTIVPLLPTFCSVSLTLTLSASGTHDYNLSVATYDAQQTTACVIGTNCIGNVLSQAIATDVPITSGSSNGLALSLGALPASVVVRPVNTGYIRQSGSGLTLWGASSQGVNVEALDADSNVIIGPGAPTLSLSAASGLTVSQPFATNEPNYFTLLAPTSGTPATVTPGLVQLTATATPVSGSGGTTQSATIPVTIAHSEVWVTNGLNGQVLGYYDGRTAGTPNVSIGGFTNAGGVAVDRNGTLYVVDYALSTLSVCPPTVTSKLSCTNLLSASPLMINPLGVAVDGNGTAYVSNGTGGEVFEFLPGGTSVANTITVSGSAPRGVAIGLGNFVYFADTNSSADVCASGSCSTISGFSGGWGMAVDALGNLFVAEPGSNQVEACSGDGTTCYTLDFDQAPVAAAVDASGNVFVTDESTNEVIEYGPFGSTSVLSTITLPTPTLSISSYKAQFVAVVPGVLP